MNVSVEGIKEIARMMDEAPVEEPRNCGTCLNLRLDDYYFSCRALGWKMTWRTFVASRFSKIAERCRHEEYRSLAVCQDVPFEAPKPEAPV